MLIHIIEVNSYNLKRCANKKPGSILLFTNLLKVVMAQQMMAINSILKKKIIIFENLTSLTCFLMLQYDSYNSFSY